MVIHIVPVLPPALSGVGDYCLHIANTLYHQWSVASRFIVCDPSWRGSDEIDGFPVMRIAMRNPEALCDALAVTTNLDPKCPPSNAPITALLQLSPYGFERNGCPFWLARGLRRWKYADTSPPRILITMFHELYAMSAPWRKAFWMSPFQRKVISNINSITDVRMTTIAKYAAYLGRQGFGLVKPDALLNTPSTVGEPDALPPYATRAPRLVVFGSRKSRQRVYRRAAEAIARFVRNCGIDEIVDIGVQLDPQSMPDLGCTIRSTGVLSASAVSAELASCVAGIVEYPPAYLGKSSIYAAYSAHGIAPIVAGAWRGHERSEDGIEDGEHFIGLSEAASSGDTRSLERVAAQAQRRYCEHSISRHAEVIAKILEARHRA